MQFRKDVIAIIIIIFFNIYIFTTRHDEVNKIFTATLDDKSYLNTLKKFPDWLEAWRFFPFCFSYAEFLSKLVEGTPVFLCFSPLLLRSYSVWPSSPRNIVLISSWLTSSLDSMPFVSFSLVQLLQKPLEISRLISDYCKSLLLGNLKAHARQWYLSGEGSAMVTIYSILCCSSDWTDGVF